MVLNRKPDRAEWRILRFLAKGGAIMHAAAVAGDKILLDGGERGVVAASSMSLVWLEKKELLQRHGVELAISQAGHTALIAQMQKANLSSKKEQGQAQEQGRKIDNSIIATADGPEAVKVNLAESPLMLLYRRKGKSGHSFIDAREFRAGERLRMDYTRGQIMPRLGINWSAIGGQGQSHDRAGGILELTDAALSARLRVEKAIEAVGPELSGVLIDVCCFLKGMKQVEIERSWPARSAKVVLKSALGALARHYEPARDGNARSAAKPAILHWGTQDYRPAIRPGT